jgi:hypothetical protein
MLISNNNKKKVKCKIFKITFSSKARWKYEIDMECRESDTSSLLRRSVGTVNFTHTWVHFGFVVSISEIDWKKKTSFQHKVSSASTAACFRCGTRVRDIIFSIMIVIILLLLL